MNKIGHILKTTIEQLKPSLEKLEEPIVSVKPAPNKWSKKEILGHLIDSASNNHQRFVRIQLQKDMVFQGYQQDEWVLLQDYQNKDWQEIIDLWYHFNKHLAGYIEQIPVEVMEKEHLEHNLYEIGYIRVEKGQVATLSYFIHDYVAHLEHHMRQIFPDFEPKVLGALLVA